MQTFLGRGCDDTIVNPPVRMAIIHANYFLYMNCALSLASVSSRRTWRTLPNVTETVDWRRPIDAPYVCHFFIMAFVAHGYTLSEIKTCARLEAPFG